MQSHKANNKVTSKFFIYFWVCLSTYPDINLPHHSMRFKKYTRISYSFKNMDKFLRLVLNIKTILWFPFFLDNSCTCMQKTQIERNKSMEVNYLCFKIFFTRFSIWICSREKYVEFMLRIGPKTSRLGLGCKIYTHRHIFFSASTSNKCHIFSYPIKKWYPDNTCQLETCIVGSYTNNSLVCGRRWRAPMRGVINSCYA